MTGQLASCDVLLMVMDLSCPRTVAAMMRTCRALYDDPKGPWMLLHDGVTLATDAEILSFSAFMFAGPTTARFNFLRTLTVAGGDFHEGAVGALTTILTHASLNIHTLIIHDAEKILGCDDLVTLADTDNNLNHDTSCPKPSLLRAFSTFTTLKHITMSSIGQNGRKLLSLLPAGLISASLTFEPLGWGQASPGEADAQNPAVHLAGSAETLEVLEGSWFDAAPVVGQHPIVYPRVRRLCASYSARDVVALATVGYAYIFPNVEFLALTAHWKSPSFGDGPHYATRQANRRDQARYGGWRQLRVVEGGIEDVWALGLTRHVRVLRVMGGVTPDRAPLLQEVLADVQPAELVFNAIAYHLCATENLPIWAVLRWPAARCVQTLEMDICFVPQSSDSANPLEEVNMGRNGKRISQSICCNLLTYDRPV